MRQVKYQLIMKIKLVALLVLVLGGCAGQVNMLPTLTQQSHLQVNQGVVVVRILNASAYPLPFNQLTLTPENLNESKDIKPERLISLPPRIDGTTVFSAPINAGRYALNSIRAFHIRGEYMYSRWVSSDAKFGTFDIKPGQVTDLGTIIFYPKPQDEEYIETLVKLPEPQIGEVLDKYFQFYKYDKNTILTWNTDEHIEEHQALFASVAQNPITYSARYLAPDNTLYFLGKLGVIIKRTAQGDWELDAVDTIFDLKTIAQNKKGDLIVGGSEGQLFWKAAGSDWQDISLEHDFQIDKLYFSNEDSIDMIARLETELIVLRADTNQQSMTWQELNKFSSDSRWYNMRPSDKNITNDSHRKAKRISGADLLQTAEGNFIIVRTQFIQEDPVFFNGDVETFGYEADTWEVFMPEKKPVFSAIVNSGAIKIGIKKSGFWSWSGRTTYRRYVNSSDSWEEIVTFVYKCKEVDVSYSEHCKSSENNKVYFNFLSLPWFQNDIEGIAVVSFSDYSFWSGKSTYETRILSTGDGGQSWTDTGKSLPMKFCSSIVPEVKELLLLSCDGATSDFYESLNNGTDWIHVRQHENF